MYRGARVAALALALCASGCWTNACIEPSWDGGVRCSEELDSFWKDETDDEYSEACGDLRAMTSCRDQGFENQCDDGYWYREACPGGGGDGGGGGGDGFPNYQPHRLSVAKAGDGAGTIVSIPAGIDCGSTCSLVYVSGARVTLTASPEQGSIFVGWSGACGGAGACTLQMDTDRSVTATFAPGAP